MNAPNVTTHIAATAEIPDEPQVTDVDRPDLPVPSLWQRGVIAISRYTGRKIIVHTVNHGTNMFRAYYPDEINPKTGELGRFDSRTEWKSFDPKNIEGEWFPETKLSPEEVQREAAKAELAAAIAALNPKEAALVNALCDNPDPAKNHAKLQLLITAGLIKGPVDVHAAAAEKAKKS